MSSFLFFFNDTATTEIYPLSLHDALPIFTRRLGQPEDLAGERVDLLLLVAVEPFLAQVLDLRDQALDLLLDGHGRLLDLHAPDRKSTRLNSSHANISYAVFCLKKKRCTDR